MKLISKSAALLAAITLAAPMTAAHASNNGELLVGGNAAGVYEFYGDTKASTSTDPEDWSVYFKFWRDRDDPVNGYVPWGCPQAKAYGDVFAGAVAGGAGHVGDITHTEWGVKAKDPENNCLGPGALPMDIAHNGVWELWVNSLKGKWTNPLADQVGARIYDVDATIYDKTVPSMPGLLCSFRVTGVADGWFREPVQEKDYDNKPEWAGDEYQILSVNETTPGDLQISNVVGCFGLFQNGNDADIITDFQVYTDGGTINFVPN
jgi:hypothetical protein